MPQGGVGLFPAAVTSLTDYPTDGLGRLPRIHSSKQQAAFHSPLAEIDSFIGMSSMSGETGSDEKSPACRCEIF